MDGKYNIGQATLIFQLLEQVYYQYNYTSHAKARKPGVSSVTHAFILVI